MRQYQGVYPWRHVTLRDEKYTNGGLIYIIHTLGAVDMFDIPFPLVIAVSQYQPFLLHLLRVYLDRINMIFLPFLCFLAKIPGASLVILLPLSCQSVSGGGPS